MSIETWREEFYPVSAKDAATDPITATEHSIRKWKGLLPAALDMLGLNVNSSSHHITDKNAHFWIDGSTCALCLYAEDQCKKDYGDEKCLYCPLYTALGDNTCDGYAGPYSVWAHIGNPIPMIRALERTLIQIKGATDAEADRP